VFYDHHLPAAAGIEDDVAGIGHDAGPEVAPVPTTEPARSRRPLRCLPDTSFEGKDIILRRCVEVICQQGLEPQDIRPRYASWRRELHTRLLREEWHYFGLDNALILAEACRVKVDFHVS